MLSIRYLGRLMRSQPRITVCCSYGRRESRYCSTNDDKEVKEKTSEPLGNMSTKYQVFQEEDSEVILDLYEERLKYSQLLEEIEEKDPYEGINMNRGVNGVFEIDDLVEVLKRENAEDIFVAAVPAEIQYVDYMCIVSGKSQKHMQALAQFVRRVYKHKRLKTDRVPRLEGDNSKDWLALDLGNIALHIFSKSARTIYDLDSLWAIGPQYDSEFNKKDAVTEILEKHAVYLGGLEPAR